ncbi:MAG: HlyC/CorC family transporter [Spirochaetales bacterium]|nr:HlyC/CorC family transporter [Spirochaetales bacterium]
MIFLYLFICLICAAFFAGMETGLLNVNRMLMQEKKEKGVLFARSVEFLLTKPERLLGTTLIGNNIANVSAAVLLTNHFESLGYESYAWIGILVMTFVFLIFNEFIPKSFLRTYANSVAARLAPFLVVLYVVFLPVYVVLNNIVKVILFFSGRHKASREELRTKRDLRFIVSLTGKEAGLPAEDQRMIEDILHFRDQIGREVMIPFHELPVLNENQNIIDAVKLAMETHYRFIPVSRNRTDNMIGYVDTNELLWKDGEQVKTVMHKARFYPETRRIPDMLFDMNRNEEEVAFLVDEYGGVAGMLTPSQIVADIVHFTPEEGTIDDDIVRQETGEYVVDGSTDLEDLSHVLGIHFKRSYASTIGGYLSEQIGIIPEENTEYREGGYVFRIDTTTERRVERVTVTGESIRESRD